MSRLVLTVMAILLVGIFIKPGKALAIMHTDLAPDMMQTDISEVENHDDGHKSLDEVLTEMLETYNKETVQELSCNELTNSDFERLGDAVMESMHPGEAHKRMDAMMGGEGSESLRLMHIQMGQRYLGCGTSNSVRNFGMMGSMMTGNDMSGRVSGYQWPLVLSTKLGGLYSILVVVTWVSFITFLLAGARWFWKKGGK